MLKKAAIMAGFFVVTSALALPSDKLLATYHHASWTARDGVPGGIWTMAQTRDGWLWLGTNFGLYRFDGISFDRYVAPARSFMLHTASP